MVLEFGKEDLVRWADRTGQRWPCSQLKCLTEADKVTVEFEDGQLIDFVCPEWVQLNAVDEVKAFVGDVIKGEFR